MPKYNIWYAGSDPYDYCHTVEQAEAEFGEADVVKASSEADAVFNWACGNDLELLHGERYFVQKLKPGGVYKADVEILDDLPIVHTLPVVRRGLFQ